MRNHRREPPHPIFRSTGEKIIEANGYIHSFISKVFNALDSK